MTQHIQPRKAHETVCALAGWSTTPEGTTTSCATTEVECGLCRVGTDLLMEKGDLFVNDEGQWQMDRRPDEFRSVYNFIEYLGEEERATFAPDELQELVRLTNQPYRETLAELRRLGYRLRVPSAGREVRGIGRLKPARK